jgi:hypothetical protein
MGTNYLFLGDAHQGAYLCVDKKHLILCDRARVRTDIVGTRYPNRGEICAKLFVGAKLSLIREPKNI